MMNIKSKIKHYLGKHPLLFKAAYRSLGPLVNQSLLFNSSTEIVFEGFPRIANTFAVVFFEKSQDKNVHIAHHLHIEGQLIWAVKNKIPAVMLIRDPEAAINSLLIRHPEQSVKNALSRYISFYESLVNYKDALVVADFDVVTKDMSKVIRDVNNKFGTQFKVKNHNEPFEELIFKEIEKINLIHDGGKETHVSRPSKLRKNTTVNVDFCSEKLLLNKAKSLYKFFV